MSQLDAIFLNGIKIIGHKTDPFSEFLDCIIGCTGGQCEGFLLRSFISSGFKDKQGSSKDLMGDFTEGKNMVSCTHRASSNLSFQIPIESLKTVAAVLIPIE